MKFVEFGAMRINLEQVSHFIDNGQSIEIFSGAVCMISLTGLDAQKFRAAVEKHNVEAGGEDASPIHLDLLPGEENL